MCVCVCDPCLTVSAVKNKKKGKEGYPPRFVRHPFGLVGGESVIRQDSPEREGLVNDIEKWIEKDSEEERKRNEGSLNTK